MSETKVCRKCGIEKPIELFCKDKNRKSGYSKICKECHCNDMRIYNSTPSNINGKTIGQLQWNKRWDSEMGKNAKKEHKLRNKPRYLLKGIRKRAKKHKIPFNLTLEDVSIPEVCPVLNIPIYNDNHKGFCDNSPSVDRIIPHLGYVKGNVRVISLRANCLKKDGTLEEFMKLIEYLKNPNKDAP